MRPKSSGKPATWPPTAWTKSLAIAGQAPAPRQAILPTKKIPGGGPPGIAEFIPRSDDQGRKSLCMRMVTTQLFSFPRYTRGGAAVGVAMRQVPSRRRGALPGSAVEGLHAEVEALRHVPLEAACRHPSMSQSLLQPDWRQPPYRDAVTVLRRPTHSMALADRAS